MRWLAAAAIAAIAPAVEQHEMEWRWWFWSEPLYECVYVFVCLSVCVYGACALRYAVSLWLKTKERKEE